MVSDTIQFLFNNKIFKIKNPDPNKTILNYIRNDLKLTGTKEGKTIEKSDDPIRMYLREMGGVELLSREGEIAIAKRIEAGKDVMIKMENS